MVVIPFSIVPPPLLKKFYTHSRNIGSFVEKLLPFFQVELNRAKLKIKSREYLSMCIFSNTILFILTAIILTLIFSTKGNYYLGILLALIFSGIIFFMQLNYPKVIAHKRIKLLDADLLSALRAIMIQLNAGVSLFEALAIISEQDFGQISSELKQAVVQISAGVPQIDALETVALKNPSPYFRRALWQIINGMKEGAQINSVISQVITSLTREQVIQIEKYGGQLSPLAMFYMIVAVIMPALGITFLVVLASFIGVEENVVKFILWGLLVGVVFFQLMFTGIIKSKRPSLLGE